MFDNHHTPSIPPRANPVQRLPPRIARTIAMAALLSLPLMLAASYGSASLWSVLLLGLAQTLLMTLAVLLLASPAKQSGPHTGHNQRSRPAHG